MAKKSAADSGPQPSFEDALKRLEAIVEELEGGELSLEDSIARYEEGMKLSRRLTQQLDEAEKRIERLVENPDGSTATEPLEPEAPRAGSPEGELPF
jgi:exodeoxyribonuclease VII small subunit